MKKIFAILLASAMLLTGCTSQAPAENNEAQDNAQKQEQANKEDSKDLQKVTVCLDWAPNTNHTGMYVALDKGYYKEQGLDVELIQPPEDSSEQITATGKAQYGISFQDTMAPALVGKDKLPITAIAALVNHNTSGILSRADKNIKTPKDLEGKTYATWDMPVEKAIIKSVMEKDGGDFDKLKLVPTNVTDIVAALTTNIDAVWVFYGWDGVASEVKGLDTNYFSFKDIDPVFDYYTPVIIVNDKYMQENPELVKKFLIATEKGYEDAIKDPAEAADILLKVIPESDPELIKKSQEYLSKNYIADGKKWGYIEPQRWENFYKWLKDNKLVDENLDEKSGFTNDYLPEN